MEEIGLRHYCSIGGVLLNRSTRIPIHGSNYNIHVSLKSPSLDFVSLHAVTDHLDTLSNTFKLAKSARLVLESLSTATNILSKLNGTYSGHRYQVFPPCRRLRSNLMN